MCESFNGALLFEPWEVLTTQGEPYRVFTPFWRAGQARLDALPAPVAPPARLRGPAPRGEPLAPRGLRPQVAWD